MMDFGIASVAAITVVCYLGGMACKASAKVNDEVIPVVCGVTGGILGVVGMYVMPDSAGEVGEQSDGSPDLERVPTDTVTGEKHTA